MHAYGFHGVGSHHFACLLVKADIELLIKVGYLILLRPLLGVRELSKCAGDVELPGPKVATGPISLIDQEDSPISYRSVCSS